MRSKSSANAFLLRYIWDLTRFMRVARSIGRLMTASEERVVSTQQAQSAQAQRTIVVVCHLGLLDLL